MAFVLPIFLLIVMGTLEFGWALRGYISATNAAREGARLGVTGAAATEVKNRAVDRSAGTLTSTSVLVCRGTTCDAGFNPPAKDATTVVVEGTYNHAFITPLGGIVSFLSGGSIPDPLPLTTSTSMRME